MADKARTYAGQGYKQLKIKAGSNDDQDRQAIELIHAAAPGISLKVDANQGWNVPQALKMLSFYEKYDVCAVEQPLPHWDLQGAAYLRARSPIAIMADESCFTPHDASAIVTAQAADIINIKLMKCGGIYPALHINAIARGAGVPTMVGCMLESRLGIAAGAHFVASDPNIIYADLDSFRDFNDSSFVTSAFDVEVPHIHLSDRPGLGVDVVAL
jgi:L-alanine-DL-glutamate epimerase-like enolase superfamily enzyme